MTKFLREIAQEDGWTEWIHPLQVPFYKAACCDCGLVHDIEIARAGREHRVIFRARRNARSTAQLRRHMKRAHG